MKTSKVNRFFCIFLSVVLCFATVVVTTYAGNSCGENVEWCFDEDSGTLTISGSGAMNDYSWSSEKPWDAYTDEIVSIVIESGVTSVGAYAFRDSYELYSVTIAGSVTDIGKCAFNYCENLQKLTLNEGLINIGEKAFEGIMELNKVTIPSTVVTIGDYAFYDCETLTNIIIPAGVTSIGVLAFAAGSALRSIDVDEGNAFYSSQDGVLFNKDKTELILYPNDNERASYVIPETVVAVSDMGFYECNYLTDVTIPGALKSVGSYCFDYNVEPLTVHFLGDAALWDKLVLDCGENDDNLLTDAEPHFCVKQGAQSATCLTVGCSDGWYCVECEAYVVEGELGTELDPNNHSFDDNGSCECGATANGDEGNLTGFAKQMQLIEYIINIIQMVLDKLF